MRDADSCGCLKCKSQHRKEKSRMILMVGSASPENESKDSSKTTSKSEEKQSLIKLLQIRFPGKVRKQKKKG